MFDENDLMLLTQLAGGPGEDKASMDVSSCYFVLLDCMAFQCLQIWPPEKQTVGPVSVTLFSFLVFTCCIPGN